MQVATEQGAAKRPAAIDLLDQKLGDQNWRLNSLYWVQDELGTETLFKLRSPQAMLIAEQHVRNVIVKARQIGFSTLITLQMLDDCLFRKNTASGIIDSKLPDAKKKLSKIKYAYDRLPPNLQDLVQLTKNNSEELHFSNGSSILVGTSHRGGTVQRMHISEYGKIAIDKPETAKEIKTGALPSVHAPYGKIWVESTAHGASGEFYDMVERAKKLVQEGRPLTAVDFKLHFFPWWMHHDYRLPSNLAIISPSMLEYFRELKAKHNIEIDAEQAAWYVATHATFGDDDMKSEYPSTLEEAFNASIQGAFFKAEMTKARLERRVGGVIPHDPSYQVHTFWDIGEDCTVVGFVQTDGLRVRVIDYWEGEGENIQSAAVILDQKRVERSFVYGTHFGPHDLEHRDWGDNSRTRQAQALDLGIKFKVIPRVAVKGDAIQAQRRLLAVTWIDQEHCGRFVDAVDNYRKVWNKALSQFTAEPLHDWASHPNDGFQQLALGLQPDRPKEDRSRNRAPSRSSAWGA